MRHPFFLTAAACLVVAGVLVLFKSPRAEPGQPEPRAPGRSETAAQLPIGNVILYTQTILNYITGLASSATTLKYSTASFVNAAWTWSTPMVVDLNFIVSRAIQFYTAMEVVHSLSLTPGVQGTNKTSYGHHWAPGTGDCVDQTITTTSKSGTVTFYIPSLCGTADQGTFVLQ